MATTFPVRADTRGAVKDFDVLINAIRKAGKEAGLTDKEIDNITRSTEAAGRAGKKSFGEVNTHLNGINKTLTTVGNGFVALFAIDKVKAFIGEMVKVTSEFQKLEALLTNTLGSRSAALQAFVTIKDQAAKTNFALTEVAGGFLKLANNGIKPTNKELTAFFDLTNNAGKSFDQFVEAVNDATRGEFMRLKEFYISASNQGNKVIFTFKGQTFEAKRNAESIKDVLVQLGELNGVAGSTAKISETLEGRISNLGDGWDTFMAQLGQGNSGALFGTVTLLSEMVRLLQLINAEGRGNLSGFDSTFLEQFFGEGVIGQGTAAFGGSTGAKTSNFLADVQKFFNDVIEAVDVKTADLQKVRQNIANELDAIAETHGIQFREEGESVRVATRLINNLVEASNKETEEARVKSLNKLRSFLDTARALRLKEEEKHAAALRKEYEALAKARDKFLDDLDAAALIAKFEDSRKAIEALRKKSSLTFSTDGIFGAGFDESLAPEDEKGITDAANEQLEAAEEADAKKKELIDSQKNYAIDAINQVLRAREISIQRELAMLDYKYNQEIALVGDNEDAKAEIAKRFDKERIALLNKQAQQQREAAIFGILVNQGPAAVKTIAQVGFVGALPFLAALAIFLREQLGNTRGATPPRFAATGEYGIDGPGTTTSDSIHYMLSRDESVVQAERSKRFGWLLQPMIERGDFDEWDLRNLVDRNLPTQLNPVFVQSQLNNSDQVEQLKLIRSELKAISKKEGVRLDFNEEGLNIYRGNENSWTKKVNKRYTP